MAICWPPLTLAVELFYSETRSCSLAAASEERFRPASRQAVNGPLWRQTEHTVHVSRKDWICDPYMGNTNIDITGGGQNGL